MTAFYDDGLRFSCTECNYCCGKEPGYVFLSENDLKALCDATEMDGIQFIATYCRRIPVVDGFMISLQEQENYDCIFLTPSGCSVYGARPRQCRTYPFWKSILACRQTWESERDYCPGIGKGRIFDKKEIEAMLAVEPNDEPIILVE